MKVSKIVKKKKIIFEVAEDESISECLQRIKQQGYRPIRRLEEPIFIELDNGDIEVYRQYIRFEVIADK